MNYQYKIRRVILLPLVAALLFTSCNKEEAEGGAPDRLFRPVLKTGLTATNNTIQVAFEKIAGAVSYTVQISRDTFKTIDQTVVTDSSVVVFTNLYWDKLYQIQARANAQDTTKSSKMGSLGSIKTPRFPTILNTPTIADISDNAVRVSWTTSGAIVTGVKILKASDSSVVRDVTLSGTDVTNAYKIVSGLKASTNYIIFLYSGSLVRGWANFTTAVPLVGNIIDLREIEGRPSVLTDTLPIVPSGSIILLKRGETYSVSSTVNLDKSITILSGTDLLNPSQAVISLVNNFNITSGSSIDSVVFKDVRLVGTDYASKYVFNINTACNVGKISFDACQIEIMRGVLRTQSQPAIIGTYKINNCIIDSIAGYGILTVDVATSKVSDITIQNSTIYKAEKIITSKNNSNSLVIENCTFNEAPRGGNYFIDYSTAGTNNVSSPIVIKNCIFGIGKDNAGNRTVNGYRVGSATTLDVSGSYATSDRLAGSAELPSLIPYPKKSTELWKDPFNGDFTIIDSGFQGRTNAGDPRWRP